MEARFEHDCDCAQETLWQQVFWSDEYNRRLFVDEFGFTEWAVVRFVENDHEIHRVLEGVPTLRREVPAAFRRFVRKGLDYRQTDVFEKRLNVCHTTIVPKLFGRRLSIHATLKTEPRGNRCRCVISLNVAANVFVNLGGASAYGIGAVLESEVIEQLIYGFQQRALFTNRYIAEKGLSAPVE